MSGKQYALGQPTRDRLMRALDQFEGVGNAQALGSLNIRLVKCTSAEAVGGSDVGDQCYPAVALNPASFETTPSELSVPCWLTVLGASGPVVPEAGRSYMAVIAGEITLTVDEEEVTLRRAFAAEAGGGGRATVKITGNATGGLYPAVLATFDVDALTYAYGAEVRARGRNGETLGCGTHFGADLAGTNANGCAVYLVDAGGNRTSANLSAVSNITCANGTMSKTVTTWTITGRDLSIT